MGYCSKEKSYSLNKWQVPLEEVSEIIHTKSDELFPLTRGDIDFLTKELKAALQDIIFSGSTVSMFLSLGEGFLSMLLYQGLIECGATVFRYGTRNLKRQLEFFDVTKTDFMIATPSLWRYIKNINLNVENIQWLAYFPLNQSSFKENQKLICKADRILMEHDKIPAYFIQDRNGLFRCPGYSCSISRNEEREETKELILSTKQITGFYLKDYPTGLNVEIQTDISEKEDYLFFIKDVISTNKISLKEKISNILKRNRITVVGQSLELDSLGMVELLVMLEEEFDFTVDVEEICYADFETIDKLVSFIKRKLIKE